MSHPIWKGNISFGLVNIPVILYSAQKANELHFHMLDKHDHSKIRYQRINENTGKEVKWDTIVKGYEYEKDHYVILTHEDFNSVAQENTKTIEIEDFVALKDIEPIFLDTPYYLLPDKRGDKGYVLLRETLKKSKKAGIARVMIHSRQHLAAVTYREAAIVVHLLRYVQDIVPLSEYHFPDKEVKEYKITKKEFDVAEQLVNAMSAPWKPARYHDDYHDNLLKIIDEKIASGDHPKRKKHKKDVTPKQTNVVDFMALLKKSVEAKKQKPAKKTPTKSKDKPKAKPKKRE